MDALPFREFDEEGEVRIYAHGILPHWRQNNCTYFVTFRQDDALPAAVANAIKQERQLWLQKRAVNTDSPTWKRQLANLPKEEIRSYERLVGKLVNEKLDRGLGSCVLKQPAIAKIVVDALSFFHGNRVLTGDLIVMPNHIQVLMRPLPTFEPEDILFSIKSFTANKINRLVRREGRFWQRESYDHIVRDIEQLEAFQDYIRVNPEKANLPIDQYAYRNAIYRFED